MGNHTIPTTNVRGYKYVTLLLALYITFLLLVVSLANRFFIIVGALEPGGMLVFPLTFLICDIISEVYGYSLGRKFIWLGVLCEFIFAFVATTVVHLPYPADWHNSRAYTIVFDPTIRYVSSSVFALLIGEFINIYILIKWKIKLQGRLFWLRSIIAVALGQAALTIIVDVAAFWGSLTFDSLVWMMICGFLWKMIYSVLLVYPTWLIIKLLKKSEGVDIYDYNLDFNPFKL